MKPIFCGFTTLVVALVHAESSPAADDAHKLFRVLSRGMYKWWVSARMILRQAIAFNLAGTAKNNADSSVQFVLQGNEKRITDALKEIEKGTDKSKNVKLTTTPGTVDSKLKTFTGLFGWTSTSRKITNPYNLVFTVRPDGSTVSEKEAA